MMFSPEDSYASNLPTPDNFDTSGLELEPLPGEEPKSPLEGYTPEQQAQDAALYSVEKSTHEVGALNNPYNLATETSTTDSDGFEVAIDSLSSTQRAALSAVMPNYGGKLNELGGMLSKADKISDFEVFSLAVNRLKEDLKGFKGSKSEFADLRDRISGMRNAFPDFSLGEEITVPFYDESGRLEASITIK